MKLKKFWESNFLMLELALAGLCSLSFALWSEFVNHSDFVNQIFLNSREGLYSTLVALFGSMLGFSITAVSIVIGYASSDKLEIVRKSKHYIDLWKVFESTMRVLALTTLLALLGLIVDKDTKPINLILYINIFLSTLSFFRIGRSIWVLENIIAIIAKPKV